MPGQTQICGRAGALITRGGRVPDKVSMRVNALPVCLRHATDLQRIVGTRHVRVSLHVERLQESQGYPVALREVDGVVALAHGRVRAWVAWAAQNPRGRAQHLAAARNCTDTDAAAYLTGKKRPASGEMILKFTADVSLAT